MSERNFGEFLVCLANKGVPKLLLVRLAFRPFAQKNRAFPCTCHFFVVPLHVASAKYRVARSTLRCWRHIARRDGYDALREVKYGRKYASMGRPKKKEPVTELEKLQRENELLRAENAYLKKLRALMTEKERLAKKTKP